MVPRERVDRSRGIFYGIREFRRNLNELATLSNVQDKR
jgi:hypothetical protein